MKKISYIKIHIEYDKWHTVFSFDTEWKLNFEWILISTDPVTQYVLILILVSFSLLLGNH